MSAATLDRMHTHDVREGVLFWGGPQHGTVMALSERLDVVRVPIAHRLTHASLTEEPLPPSLATQEVQYRGQRFARHDEMWWVYVYGDGEHRLIKNLTGTLRLLEWMCEPFNE